MKISLFDLRTFCIAVLTIVFNLSRFYSQSLIPKIIQSYHDRPLAYSFKEERYSKHGKIPVFAKGKVYAALKDGLLQYKIRIDGPYDTLEIIKNNSALGCNNYRRRHYENYLKHPAKSKHTRFEVASMFLPDSGILKHFNKSPLTPSLDSTADFYVLRYFSDTPTMVPSNIGELLRKKIDIRYYVNRKTYKVEKTTSYINLDLGGEETRDSTVRIYAYQSLSEKKIVREINRFTPLQEAIEFIPAPAPRAESMPPFNLQDTSGNLYNHTMPASRFVLIDFWYKSCGPCLLQFPNLKKVRDKYSHDELTVLAINPFDKMDEDMRTFIRKKNYPFVYLFNAKKLQAELKIDKFPSTILYDNVTKKIIFFEPGSDFGLEEHIAEAISKHEEKR